ncbi:response regulator [Romboutsia sp.]|uniref:response regulator n=1 Tax=Romboutsia sp. TaxID=1965302 RepID=UPI002BCCF0B1|nr:response regulator [Romboutsia sp.]HSQ89269.1 response regulator [Romboutsia sp.]
MHQNFYIVDDDKAIQKMLKNIISKNNQGEIIGMSGNGLDAIKDIKRLNPDIVLVDLLLPGIDGVGVVSTLKEHGRKSAFIMISEVSSKKMISKAYEHGIEFYINKPINVIEVISVIERVKEKIRMSMVIDSFEKAMNNMNMFRNCVLSKEVKVDSERDNVERVLAQLGILGEAGKKDIVQIILWLKQQGYGSNKAFLKYKLSEVYEYLNDKYIKEYSISSNANAIEQRVRRAINKALKNIANLGIEDYSNDVFIRYSSTLFDFKEVRREMDYIRGKSNYGGTINVKKFIEGINVILRDD